LTKATDPDRKSHFRVVLRSIVEILFFDTDPVDGREYSPDRHDPEGSAGLAGTANHKT
jgi:hypothetical protein